MKARLRSEGRHSQSLEKVRTVHLVIAFMLPFVSLLRQLIHPIAARLRLHPCSVAPRIREALLHSGIRRARQACQCHSIGEVNRFADRFRPGIAPRCRSQQCGC